MASIYAGQAGSGVSDENKRLAQDAEARAKRQMRTTSQIPVNQIEEDYVTMSDGSTIKIHPKRIAQNVQFAISLMLSTPRFNFLKPYIKKPVIWTYEAEAAFTDGIRIFMNPIFANQMLKMGSKMAMKYQDDQQAANPLWKADPTEINWQMAKFVVFVIVHECYHVLYQHIKRERLLLGNDYSQHQLANIAADLEINRDIESCFPQLRGATTAIGGVWWENPDFCNINLKKGEKLFERDIFEDILRWMIEHNIQPSDEAKNSPFNDNTGSNNKDDKSNTKYGNGWDVAVRAIQNGTIDPENIPFI